MRIIAGTARGTPLVAPQGMDTRPTRDQVKESLFSILQGELAEATVLDLFAGSGALGLEALSRGAKRAVLADRDREAVQCVKRNVEKLRFESRAAIYPLDWERSLERAREAGEAFDLVFLDPPYRMRCLEEICAALRRHGLLNPEALLVLEHAADYAPGIPPGFSLVKERAYRDTAIHFFRFAGEE